MGIRETLNKNPSITTGVTIGIIVVALVAILWQAFSNGNPNIANVKSFYTVDDGKTWFKDEAIKNPPYDYNGAQAVRIYVYKCASGKEFSAYMERFTPDALSKIEKVKANPNGMDPMAMETIYNNGMEVKRPGDPKWVTCSSVEGLKIQHEIKCPDGSTDGLVPVAPE